MLASEALREAEAQLARVNRVTTLGVLAASIAHEVNQPLGGVVTSAASCSRWLAADPPDLERARRSLERIAKDGRRASEVIDRIRALVQRHAPRRDAVDINETIGEAIALVRDEAHRKDVAVHTRLATGLPPVPGDRIQLQQVILNLIINAIEAMDEVEDRSRELLVECGADTPSGVVVAVRDSGSGFDAERRGDLRRVLHDQARRHRHGARDQPLDHRSPRRTAVGDAERASRRGLPVLAARRRGGALAAGMMYLLHRRFDRNAARR